MAEARSDRKHAREPQRVFESFVFDGGEPMPDQHKNIKIQKREAGSHSNLMSEPTSTCTPSMIVRVATRVLGVYR
jgi:hypothetical protein